VVRFGTLTDNTIHGGAGDDTLIGRAGDDVLIGAEGDDLVQGQGGNDDLNGGDGDDKVLGGVGDDIMHGGAGNDRLVGGRGADVLFGGQGRDSLSGGDGADQFHFTATGSAPDVKNADLIVDFRQASHDVIDLSDFDARPASPTFEPFTFIGTSAFSGAGGELRYEFSGGETLLIGDTDGDRASDFLVRLDGNIALTDADFVLTAPDAPLAGVHAFMAQLDLHAEYRVYQA
jgi:Ca2+-binding RTX toxin-like protein